MTRQQYAQLGFAAWFGITLAVLAGAIMGNFMLGLVIFGWFAIMAALVWWML